MNSKQFLKEGFLEDAHEAHSDHEVQMARVDCYYAAEHAIVLHKLLRNISEEQGLEGWVASKITLANDYLKSVREHLEYQMMNVDAGEDDFLPLAEGLKPVKKNSVVESTAPVAEDEEEKFQDFERGPWYVIVKGNPVSVDGVPKKFNWLNGAKTYFRSMMDKNPEMAQKIKREYDEASDKKSVIYYTKNLPTDNTTSTEQPVSESEKPGLWANIRAKRKRIKGGSGERMRKPGSKGAPSDKDLKSIRAASESVVKEGDLHSDFGDIVQKVKGEWEAKRAKERQGMGPKYAPEQSKEELESRLRELESKFDPEYQYSDDYSFWTKQNAIAREIASIKKKLGSQGVAEGIPDVDHMHGPRGINLSWADTRDLLQKPFEHYGNYKEWYRDVNRVNSELLDDNAEFSTMSGGKIISINGKDFAFWSNRNGNGSIDIGIAKKHSGQGVAEGSSKQFEIIYLDQSGNRKRKIVSGTSKEAVVRQFKKQYKLEIEQVKQLQQGVAEGVTQDFFNKNFSQIDSVIKQNPKKILDLLIGMFPNAKEAIVNQYNDEEGPPFAEWRRVIYDIDDYVLSGPVIVNGSRLPIDPESEADRLAKYQQYIQDKDSGRPARYFRVNDSDPRTIDFSKLPPITIAQTDQGMEVTDGNHRAFLAKMANKPLRAYVWKRQSNNHPNAAKIKSLFSNQQGVAEDLADDLAKYARWQAAVGGAVGIGIGAANYADDQRPKVDIGGQQAYYVENPDWGKVPYNAMTLTDKDGKEYKVWTVKGGGGKVWYATPTEKVKEGVAEGQGSIINKCASLAAKYFNSAGLQQQYDIDEFIKINTGDNVVVNKCASLAAKYFNSAGLQQQYDIDEYIKAHAKDKQGVAEGSDNSVEALIQVYNNRDQKIVKTKVFRSEDEANRWADRNNATILKLKDVAKKSTIDETTAGSIAGVVNPKIKNKSKVGTLFGGTYRQQKDK